LKGRTRTTALTLSVFASASPPLLIEEVPAMARQISKLGGA